MSILVFLGLSVLDLGPMYATDVRRASSFNAPYPRGVDIITNKLYAGKIRYIVPPPTLLHDINSVFLLYAFMFVSLSPTLSKTRRKGKGALKYRPR